MAARRSKTIDDPLLNRLGLQVARTVAGHATARSRRWPLPADPQLAQWIVDLRSAGCLEIRNFLDPDLFEQVRAAACSSLDDQAVPRDRVEQGANELEVVWRDDVPEARRTVLDEVFAHPTVTAMASAAERIAVEPGAGRCLLQRLTQHEGPPDREASLHSDTFHPTHKIWLYLTDVTEQDGPLVFYPGSHRLTTTSLRAIYQESVGPNEGSRRIAASEIERRGLEPKVFLSPANTLVIADTTGFHGRIQGRPPGTRDALHMELRPDPFFRRTKVLRVDHPVSAATRSAQTAMD